MSTKLLKYAVIGAGGVGATMSSFMTNAGKNVTVVARGAHLEAIRRNGGLKIIYTDGKQQLSPVKAVSAEEITEKADVIFVTTKAYSFDSIIPAIQELITPYSIVIPIQNSMFAGDVLRSKLPSDICVFDGCIYVAAYLSGLGEVTQNNPVLKVIFGPKAGTCAPADTSLCDKIPDDMKESKIDCLQSEHMPGEIFKKISFTSAYSAAAIPFDTNAGGIKTNPDYLKFYTGLSQELQRIADKAQFGIPLDIVSSNNAILNNFVADSFTSSLQKDIKKGIPGQDERQELLFDVVKLARSLKVDVPLYEEATRPLGLKL